MATLLSSLDGYLVKYSYKEFKYTFEDYYDIVTIKYFTGGRTTSLYFIWQWFSSPGIVTQDNSIRIRYDKYDVNAGAVFSGETIYFVVENFSDWGDGFYIRIYGDNYNTVVIDEPVDEIIETVEDNITEEIDTETDTIDEISDEVKEDITDNTESTEDAIEFVEIIIEEEITTETDQTINILNETTNNININLEGVLGDVESYMKESSYEISTSVRTLTSETSTGLTEIGERIKTYLTSVSDKISDIVNIGWGLMFKTLTFAVTGIGKGFIEAFMDTFFTTED